ncbi:MAG: response regulator [Betaproteobacteria bacterium]
MRKLLIVDDSAVVRDRLEQLLARLQGVGIVTGTGRVESGRKPARKRKPDAVIMDAHTRSGRGMKLLRDVKRADPRTPVIVLTNEACPENQQHGLAAGADYFYDKSSEYPQLGSVLGNIPARSGPH